MSDVYVCIYKQASTQDQVVWGDAPPENFKNLDAMRLLMGQFLAVLHAFAKPADLKFPQEKVLRLAE